MVGSLIAFRSRRFIACHSKPCVRNNAGVMWCAKESRMRVLMISSLRASSPIWASEASRARTRERAAKPRGAGERIACNHPFQIFLFVLRPAEGKYHWLKNDVPEIKVD